jgi:hypothetical protein
MLYKNPNLYKDLLITLFILLIELSTASRLATGNYHYHLSISNNPPR